MSAQSGIYNFNGGPVESETLAAMGNTLSDWGPDGARELLFGSVGMTFHAFHTNLESRFQSQPLVAAGRYVLTFDGRLDNRADLLAELSDYFRGPASHIGDAAIVGTAYDKWGVNCFHKLVGDFALALWDHTKSHLILARDPFGLRTLFYHTNRTRIVWASQLLALITRPEIGAAVADEYVAGFLTRFPEPWETPYKGVWAVKPGYFVIVQEERIQEKQFWSLSQQEAVRYNKDEDYEAHFRVLFEESIRSHTRTTHPVLAQLSGGLDSSAIVCMTDRLMKSGQSIASDLRTVSFVYDEARTSDERPFIRAVEDHIGNAGYYLREEDASCLSFDDENPFISAPTFGHCFAQRNAQLRKTISDCDARIIVTGQGGDQLLYSSEDPSPELADLLARWKFFELHKRTTEWSLISKKPYVKHLWQATLMAGPYSLTTAFRLHKQVPVWIDKSFATRLKITERLAVDRDIYKYKYPSERDQSRSLSSTIAGLSTACMSEWLKIDVAHPYLHRPLVEFLQSLPPDQRLRPGETRSLMRRALRDVLPTKVLQRRGKQGPDEALYRAVLREWTTLRQMFSDPLVCKAGYVDQRRLVTALDRARHGAEEYTFKLLITISLELWLRSLENLRATVKAKRRTERVTTASQNLAHELEPSCLLET